jgi:hypothetical protein
MATIKEVDLLLKVGGVWKSVDVDASTSFSIKMQQKDITDPAATLNDYSTQISLPKTPGNNIVFGHIGQYDHEVSRGFNPLVRTPFMLYVRGNLFQAGYMKVEELTKNVYKIRLYGELGDFFYGLSGEDNELRDLPFGTMFDHTIDRNYVLSCQRGGGEQPATYYDHATGSNIYENILTYALTYQGAYDDFDNKTEYSAGALVDATWRDPAAYKEYAEPELTEHGRNRVIGNEFFCGEYRSYYQRPAVKFKVMYNAVLDRAVAKGWKVNLDPSFFNNNNPYWAKLWMMCPQLDVKNSISPDNNIWVGANDGTVQLLQEFISDNGSNTLTESISTGYSDLPDENKIQQGKTYLITGEIVYRVKAISKDNTPVTAITKRNTARVNFNLTIGTDTLYFTGDRYFADKDYDGSLDAVRLGSKIPGFFLDAPGSYDFYYDKSDDRQYSVGSDLIFRAKINMLYTYGSSNPLSGISLMAASSGDTYWIRANADRNVAYSMALEIQPASYINISEISAVGLRSLSKVTYGDIIKSEEDCFKFLTSYNKLFGLYYVKNDAEKTIDIMTRNTFYGAKDIADWTEKIDYSRDVTTNPVPFTYKRGVFKWPDNETKYEQAYLKGTGKSYGSMLFDTGYEFNSDDKDYLDGVMFNNAIVATDYSQYYLGRNARMYRDNKALPHFQDADGGKVDTGYCLFFDAGISEPLKNRYTITDDTSVMYDAGFCWSDNYMPAGTCQQFYRTLLFNGNTYSLYFGEIGTARYNDLEPAFTENDALYGRFWKRYINDLFNRNNKVMTCHVNLSTADVTADIFRKFIFINNTAWVIDKIHGFNPLSKASTKVTLVKVQDIENYTSGQRY